MLIHLKEPKNGYYIFHSTDVNQTAYTTIALKLEQVQEMLAHCKQILCEQKVITED